MNNLFRPPYIGLALGGGGARGLAHIGVLKALMKANIPIHCLAGSSMGGLIAGLFAAGVSIETLEEEALKLSKLTEIVKLLDLAPARRGLFKADRIQSFLQNLLIEDQQIETLPIPLALTAVDLISRKEVLITKGSLIKGLMATTCVPGLFSPIPYDDHLLIDGGVLNNVPADVVRKMGAEFVVAVDVNHIYDEDSHWAQFSATSTLTKFLPKFALDFYQAEIIMVSALTFYKLKKAKPDVLLRPPIPADVNIFLGFTHAETSIASGEIITREHISKILAKIKPAFRFPHSLP